MSTPQDPSKSPNPLSTLAISLPNSWHSTPHQPAIIEVEAIPKHPPSRALRLQGPKARLHHSLGWSPRSRSPTTPRAESPTYTHRCPPPETAPTDCHKSTPNPVDWNILGPKVWGGGPPCGPTSPICAWLRCPTPPEEGYSLTRSAGARVALADGALAPPLHV